MKAGLQLHVALRLRQAHDAREAYRLAHAYRDEELAKAGARQLAFAREHWLPTEGDSVSAAAKKERKYGVAEKLVSLIDPTVVLRPRHIRVLPADGGFLVRWQVGDESKSTFRKTQAAADAAAAELRELAGKDTGGGSQPPAGESTHTADFFQPGRTYTDGNGYRAPELVTYFRVEHITRHPERGHLRAIGWMKSGTPNAPWHGHFQDEGEFEGWTEVTDGGEA